MDHKVNLLPPTLNEAHEEIVRLISKKQAAQQAVQEIMDQTTITPCKVTITTEMYTRMLHVLTPDS